MKKTKTILITILCIITFQLSAQIPTWEFFKDLGELETAVSVAHTDDNAYLVTGHTNISSDFIFPYEGKWFLMKINNEGEEEWTNFLLDTLDSSGGNIIEKTPDGGFIMAGGYKQAGLYHFVLMKLDGEGNEEWMKVLNEVGVENEYTNSINNVQVTQDGGYILFGRVDDEENELSMYLSKLEPDGTEEWTKYYPLLDGENAGIAKPLIEIPNEGYLFASRLHTPFNDTVENTMFLYKTDINGNLLWTLPSPVLEGVGRFNPVSILINENEGTIFLVADKKVAGGEYNSYIAKLDYEGNIIWETDLLLNEEPSLSITSYMGAVFTSSGNIMINSILNFEEIYFSEISQEDGSLISQKYSGNLNLPNTISGIHLFDMERTPDGGYITVGETEVIASDTTDPIGISAYIAKFNEQGCLVTSSTKEIKESIQVKLSPNPTADILFIEIKENVNFVIDEVKIFNTNGINVKTFSFNGNSSEIDLSYFRKGMYFLQFLSENRRVGHEKIVKN